MMAVDRSQTRNALIGAGIVVAISAVTMVVFFAPAIARLLRPTIEIVMVMNDAGALKKDSPVWLAGREVGTVVSVGFRGAETDSAERVAVRVEVPRKYASQLRRDSEARVTSQQLIGEPVIDITPGSPSAPALRHLDTLRVRPRGSMLAVLENAERLNASFAQLFADMRAYKAPVRRRVADLERMERQLERSMTGFRTLVGALRSSPMGTFSEPAWQRMLSNLGQHAQQLDSALSSAAERARAAHREVSPALERMAVHADTIRSVLHDLEARIEQGGGGILIRAQRDSAIVKRLHQVQLQLDSLIDETKRNPLRFWF